MARAVDADAIFVDLGLQAEDCYGGLQIGDLAHRRMARSLLPGIGPLELTLARRLLYHS